MPLKIRSLYQIVRDSFHTYDTTKDEVYLNILNQVRTENYRNKYTYYEFHIHVK